MVDTMGITNIIPRTMNGIQSAIADIGLVFPLAIGSWLTNMVVEATPADNSVTSTVIRSSAQSLATLVQVKIITDINQ